MYLDVTTAGYVAEEVESRDKKARIEGVPPSELLGEAGSRSASVEWQARRRRSRSTTYNASWQRDIPRLLATV